MESEINCANSKILASESVLLSRTPRRAKVISVSGVRTTPATTRGPNKSPFPDSSTPIQAGFVSGLGIDDALVKIFLYFFENSALFLPLTMINPSCIRGAITVKSVSDSPAKRYSSQKQGVRVGEKSQKTRILGAPSQNLPISTAKVGCRPCVVCR